MNKQPTSFRLSPEALELLRQLAKHFGVSQAAVLEMLIRDKARDCNLQVQAVPLEKE